MRLATGRSHICLFWQKKGGGFLLYGGVNSAKKEEGFAFTIFALFHTRVKSITRKGRFPIKFHCLHRSLCSQMKETPYFPYHLHNPTPSISSSLNPHCTTTLLLEIVTKVDQIKLGVSLRLSTGPFN